jgi:hypothetical protein
MSRELTERQQALQGLLHRRPVTFPVEVFGLLGGDPNTMTLEEQMAIAADLLALGYEERVSTSYSHAHFITSYVREEIWPGETWDAPRLAYTGIPLRPDPEFRRERREALARKRTFFRRLDELYGKA